MRHTKSAVKYARYARPSGRSAPTLEKGRPTTSGTSRRSRHAARRSARPKRGSANRPASGLTKNAAGKARTGATTMIQPLRNPATHSASSVRLLKAKPHAPPTNSAAIHAPGSLP